MITQVTEANVWDTAVTGWRRGGQRHNCDFRGEKKGLIKKKKRRRRVNWKGTKGGNAMIVLLFSFRCFSASQKGRRLCTLLSTIMGWRTEKSQSISSIHWKRLIHTEKWREKIVWWKVGGTYVRTGHIFNLRNKGQKKQKQKADVYFTKCMRGRENQGSGLERETVIGNGRYVISNIVDWVNSEQTSSPSHLILCDRKCEGGHFSVSK